MLTQRVINVFTLKVINPFPYGKLKGVSCHIAVYLIQGY